MMYIHEVAVNRNAPKGCESITMYSTELSGDSLFTIGQLAQAVSLRAAAAYEAQSINKMNVMTSGSLLLEKASSYMQQIADEQVTNWAATKSYLVSDLGIDESSLPDGVETYNKRLKAITAIKAKVDALTQQQQEDMIDLQTLVNRRDVAYSTSSNIVRTLGTSMEGNSANIIG